MPKLSRNYPGEETILAITTHLFDAFALLENETQVSEFLTVLLTRTEIKMLAKRLAIAQMYYQGFNYQEIGARLKVSDSTIARITSQLRDSKIIIRLLKELAQIDKSQIETQPQIASPMDKYTRLTRPLGATIGQAAFNTISYTAKTLKQKSRHHRIKSNLIKRRANPTS